jgi:hypothetical protein
MDNSFDEIVTIFIMKTYPISRIKINKRFKRAIVINSVAFAINDQQNKHTILNKIVPIIEKIFGLTTKESVEAINKTIHLF